MSEFCQGCVSPAIDLWLLSTDLEPIIQQAFKACLSPAEQAQLQRIPRPAVQEQFLASRGCLRYLLSRYTDQAPAALTFVYGSKGKPKLSSCGGKTAEPPRFNLSHSGQRLLVAISTAAEVSAVGVDIESLRPVKQLPGLCRRCLTAAEAAAVLSLPHPQADHQFLRYWTGKEACLKSLGLGIADSMETLELILETPEPSSVPSLVNVATQGADYPGQLYQWQLEPGYISAIAVQGSPVDANCLRLRQTTPAAVLAEDWPNPR